MTGCVHRRVIIEDLNRKASSAIGKFFIVFAIIWIGFAAFKALFLCFAAYRQFASAKCRSLSSGAPLQAILGQRSTPVGHSRSAERPAPAFSASGAPSPALTASGAPLRPSRPAEHPCTGSLGQRSTSPALTASGAPLQRPAEHLSGPLGQRSTSPALTASGAPLHRPSRPAERLYRPLPGQRSAFRCQL
ncbi:translation initiation factor IF-2-like isoform X6 [Drosophila albomicans]|uniref:Translation initiation factor IF-2-like isoform X6 n=1 Tax=Drosophila albomicans TaxID=7291 RepID=A0A9C6SQP8_DROAB|nr:translation initiation factor IF-2-like isoform X6 [Drosophila albomicans]